MMKREEPKSLRGLGIDYPRTWNGMVHGERMDWLKAVIDCAARELNAIDRISLRGAREDLSRLHSSNSEPWRVT